MISLETFSSNHSLATVLWMLLQRGKIKLDENPCLYQGLPGVYSSDFYKMPIQLNQRLGAFKSKALALMVLTDRKDLIRVDCPQLRRTFGNIWNINQVIILKGTVWILLYLIS
jgi:hypothetical protein